jgi:tryptophanyl-tRNA synthetase
MSKKRIVSGMRPSGMLHLGHLHGVLDNWLNLQRDYDSFFFIADWHALTSEYSNPAGLTENIEDMVLDWLAVGVDPEKSTIFLQSCVKEHAELHLLLSMITPLSWLERNPTYKEQLLAVKERDLHTYGFLGYPVLQTADIIAYNADEVPVGVDQAPHIELSREIVRRFNHLYGNVFTEPGTMLTEIPKVLGTDGRKMSKSYNNSIYLSDSANITEKKILTMKTDPARKRRNDKGNPELCPVFLSFHQVYSDEKRQAWVREGCTTAGIGCIDCKKSMIPNVLDKLKPIQKKRMELEGEKGLVREILGSGGKRARDIAASTLEKVRRAMNLDYSE